LRTYNEDFFTFSFFILSTFGAGAAPEVLMVASLPAKVEVCLSGAPAASPATFNDGSTRTKGTLCLVVASSPAALSSTLFFEHLGKEASSLEKKRESVQKLAQEEFKKGTRNGMETLT
jgi:hypothetical protein